MTDDYLQRAAAYVVTNQFAAPDRLQRHLRIRYSTAERLLDELQQHGVVGPSRGSLPRDVLTRTVPNHLGGAA